MREVQVIFLGINRKALAIPIASAANANRLYIVQGETRWCGVIVLRLLLPLQQVVGIRNLFSKNPSRELCGSWKSYVFGFLVDQLFQCCLEIDKWIGDPRKIHVWGTELRLVSIRSSVCFIHFPSLIHRYSTLINPALTRSLLSRKRTTKW